MKQLITFPLVEKQTCWNCGTELGTEELLRNMMDRQKDAYGIPAVMIRCPVCKTPFEWETRCS
ncbi:MAG: hypothetical protein AB1390_01400 [Nitrospirota bacterium]